MRKIETNIGGYNVIMWEEKDSYNMKVDFKDDVPQGRFFKLQYEKGFLDNPDTFQKAKEVFLLDLNNLFDENNINYRIDVEHFLGLLKVTVSEI